MTVTNVTDVTDAAYCADTIWCTTLTAGSAAAGTGYSVDHYGSLPVNSFDFGGRRQLDGVLVNSSGSLAFSFFPQIDNLLGVAGLTLHVDSRAFAFTDASDYLTIGYVWDSSGLTPVNGQEVAVKLTRAANNPATGAPVIQLDGTAIGATAPPVDQALTVDVSAIADTDGILDVDSSGTARDAGDFNYQWIRVDGVDATNVGTAAIYTVTAADLGKTLKVKATFTDTRFLG